MYIMGWCGKIGHFCVYTMHVEVDSFAASGQTDNACHLL